MADPAGGENTRLVYWGAVAVVVLTTPVVLLEWVRPFDVRTVADPGVVLVIAVIACVALLVAVMASRLLVSIRVLGSFVIVVALVPLVVLAGLVLVFGSRRVETTSRVPGTRVSIAVMTSDEVVLRGKLGPIPRERVVLDTEGCFVFIRSTGDRTAQLHVTDPSSSCDVEGDYLVTVDKDGWSTTIERTD